MPRKKIEYTNNSNYDSMSIQLDVTATNSTDYSEAENKVIRVELKER